MRRPFPEATPLAVMVPKVLQVFLNIALIGLAITLSFLLMRSLVEFIQLLWTMESYSYKLFLADILLFFLYFEFIAMIVKYFKEDYHFPLRYFLYIGITAMTRVIIVEHDNPVHTLLNALVIFILIGSYFIINMTPRERPDPVQPQKKSLHLPG
ncbi:phosphate-starvation-inducible protein PsiE [Chryseomicrobium sp. FSL W7-1435]|uniref:phosphate-starvation-inducible protein PsiE n=1 Tax=Chryseomicrobium sp. FSL W7-1435 TaxID=2921704 RepID=UPI00315B1E9D